MPPVINKTTDAGLAEEQQTYYNRVLLTRVLPNIVWPLFGQPKPMPQKEGQTIYWRGFNSLPAATTPLEEGVTPDGETLTMTHMSAVPVQYGTYVKITDVVDLVSPDPVLTETAQLLGEQAAETYDILVRDKVTAGTNVLYAAGVKTADIEDHNYLTTLLIQKAVRTMHQNKMKKMTSIMNASTGVGTTPIAASYIGIIDASTLFDLKTESGGKFVPVHQYPSTIALLPYEVGSVDEVRFILTDSPKIKAAAGKDGQDVHCTIILARDAYGVVSLQGIQNIVKGFGSGDDPLNQRMTSGWKSYFTTLILQQLAVLRVEHSCSA